MADTGIEWTDKSWNPIVGCTITSPGCTNCYAMSMAARLERMNPDLAHYAGLTKEVNGKPVWTGKVAMAPDHKLTEPLRRRKPTMYFVNSMGDLFHPDVPDEWIERVFAVMALAPQHIFQVLTKQSKRMRSYFARAASRDRSISTSTHLCGGICTEREMRIRETTAPFLSMVLDASRPISFPLRNVWLGVSAEDQKHADQRIPDLLATPAAVRFVSAEPMLGPVDFTSIPMPPPEDEGRRASALHGHEVAGMVGNCVGWIPPLTWVIVGGESGPGARTMDNAWAQSIVDQCKAAGVAVFVKQLSSGGPKAIKDMALFPEGLRVRQMPEDR